MITTLKMVSGETISDAQYMGLSTDTKPNASVNSLFLELDTGDFYYLKTPATGEAVKTTILEETTFTGTESDDYYQYVVEGSLEISESEIKVNFDGTVYTLEDVTDDPTSYHRYGNDTFGIMSSYDDRGNRWTTSITLGDSNEHTIEIYTEEGGSAVWEKVGGSSNSSSSDEGGGNF